MHLLYYEILRRPRSVENTTGYETHVLTSPVGLDRPGTVLSLHGSSGQRPLLIPSFTPSPFVAKRRKKRP